MAEAPAGGPDETAAEGKTRSASQAPTARLGLASLLLCGVLGCAGGPPGELKQIRFAEQVLGTAEEEVAWNFHALLEYRSTDNDPPTGFATSGGTSGGAGDERAKPAS